MAVLIPLDAPTKIKKLQRNTKVVPRERESPDYRYRVCDKWDPTTGQLSCGCFNCCFIESAVELGQNFSVTDPFVKLSDDPKALKLNCTNVYIYIKLHLLCTIY